MNKSTIKKFAIEARKKLIASVSDKAGMLGITEDDFQKNPITKGADFEIYRTAAGTEITLNEHQCHQRELLVQQLESRGYEAVIEEVAYTWFNRICAIRFMEVNDYLPTRVRVLSSEKEGKNEPDLVTQAPDVDLDFTDEEREWIIEAKMNNKLDDLFKMLFIKQCNKLHEILPELFEETEDYTEMLLNLSYTNEDDVIYMLVNQDDGIPEADFNVSAVDENGVVTGQVEIIGWLYQYYNTELKDDTFAKLKKNIKITKERIPAATQLFTPDWIVRYMVENSVGRIWIEHLRALDSTVDEKTTAERFGWKYYLPEAEQEEAVNIKLAEIRTDYKDLQPTDIKCIDPCMGSGHILIAMFDVLMDIYKSAGYSERDAAFDIVENNIHGLDIDKRAYQLAYFAVMMKGRGYNRRFFRGRDNVKPVPRVYAIMESNEINREHIKYFGKSFETEGRMQLCKECYDLLDEMVDARKYGSALIIKQRNWDLLFKYIASYEINNQLSFDTIGINGTKHQLARLFSCCRLMAQQYLSVVTNPPYMGSGGMDDKLSEFVKEKFTDSKSDMFAVFIERCHYFTKKNAFYALITQPSIIVLASLAKLRKKIVYNSMLCSVLYMGRGIFGIDFGSAAFVLRKGAQPNFIGDFFKLFERTFQYIDLKDIEKLFLESKNNLEYEYDFSKVKYDSDDETEDYEIGVHRIHYRRSQNIFDKIDNSPWAFWLSDKAMSAFDNDIKLSRYIDPKIGMVTGDTNRFLRYWFEVSPEKIGYGFCNSEEAEESKYKWFPYQKGGNYRKWYGNLEYVVNWENGGYEIKFDNYMGKRVRSHNYNGDNAFRSAITYSSISSGPFSARLSDDGFLYDVAGPFCKVEQGKLYLMLGFILSKVAKAYMDAINPTINFVPGTLLSIPYFDEDSHKDKIEEIKSLVKECIEIEREEWNSYELSWDFKVHPLGGYGKKRIEDAVGCWSKDNICKFTKLKLNEEIINELFIDIYGMNNELTPKINEKYVTYRMPDAREMIITLISYAIGCMFGRYFIANYTCKFDVDDNIIPITDEEYFTDDIVARFVEFVKTVYGKDTLEENLDFIANALNGKGATPREVIRNYFLKDFYADHLKVYQKRPIYWLFDSGKQNGFKALIYMHRYDADTVGRVRTDYLHKAQNYVETAMKSAQYTIDNATSTSEKSKATKAVAKYTKQLAEMQSYDEAIAHIANQRIEIDLDDGVKVNYAKFQGVEVAQEGKKAIKINLLAKI